MDVAAPLGKARQVMGQAVYHIPALLAESVDGLRVKPDGIYVDATFGGGGHSRAIMERLGANGRLIGFDQDIDARQNSPHDGRFTFVHGNFAYVRNFLRYNGIGSVDGIIADLGVSFHHFDDPERGFSFRTDCPLDMRMNQLASLDAATVVGSYSEERLADVLYLYGELRTARRLAAAIVKQRQKCPIATTGQLVEAVSGIIKPSAEKKELAQLFQALRIEVNGEVGALERLLASTPGLLNSGGRLVVLTYHSIEDRMVKNFIRAGNVEGKVEKDIYGHHWAPLKAVNNRVITPSDEEIARNPRSRSAKLRIAERVQ